MDDNASKRGSVLGDYDSKSITVELHVDEEKTQSGPYLQQFRRLMMQEAD
jgi:hypothetical protein